MANNNYIGMGSGLSDPYLQAARFQQVMSNQPYAPQGQMDAQTMAQQMLMQNMMMNQQQRSAMFNQENPRMALPQNIGATLGGILSGGVNSFKQALSPSQSGNPQQNTPQDPEVPVQQEFYKRLGNMAPLFKDPKTGVVNLAAAQYAAASSLGTDPQYQQNPVAQGFVSRIIADSKEKGYTPETDAASQAATAQKVASTADAADKDAQTKLAVRAAQDKAQYVPIKWTRDSSGNMYPQQVGPYIPKYIDDNLTVDPNLSLKQNAAIEAAGGAKAGVQVMPLEDFNSNKALQAQYARETAVARIQSQAQAQKDKMNDVDMDTAKKFGHSIAAGLLDPNSSFAGTGTAAAPMKQMAMKFAYAENPDLDFNQAHNIPANLKAFQSGSPYQQFSRQVTVPAHLEEAREAANGLGNGSFAPGNALYQKALQMNGGRVAAPFELAKDLAFTELNAGLSPRGGADEGIQRLIDQVKIADNPGSLNAAFDKIERFWQEKAFDTGQSFETATNLDAAHPVHHFVGDQLRDPVAVDMLTKRYPIELPTGKAGHLYFDRLPDTAWVKQGDGIPAQVKDWKRMMGETNVGQ